MNPLLSKSILTPCLTVTLLVIGSTALAQGGTATGPFTVHEVEDGPIVLVGDDASPMPIDAEPGGLPWTKGFFDPKAFAAGNVTVDIIETIENVGTESWSDWHEHIIGDPASATGPSFWSSVVDLKVNGSSIVFNVIGLGTKDLTLDSFSPLVQPGDILTIHKQVDVFNTAGEIDATLVRMQQYPSIAIPEPSTCLLMLLGLTAAFLRRRTSFPPIAAGLSFAAMLLVTCGSLHAGEISAWTWSPTGIASVALAGVPPIVDINNDGVAGISPNALLVTQKAYFSIGPVDIEFTVAPSGGVTEYTIREGVDNGTGVDWSAYRIELGFGLGADFVLSTPGDGLDFDAADFNSPPDFSGTGYFTTVAESEDVLFVSGGIFPVGGFPSPLFRFNIDVPDGIPSFTIRQQPIAVPEPSSLLLTVLTMAVWVPIAGRNQ